MNEINKLAKLLLKQNGFDPRSLTTVQIKDRDFPGKVYDVYLVSTDKERFVIKKNTRKRNYSI